MNKSLFIIGIILIYTPYSYAQQEKRIQIEKVTIVSKKPQEIYKTGKNVTFISSQDLEKYKGQNLNDVLNQVSGIQITGNFNNASEPKIIKIRSGNSSNVVILQDDIPLRDVTGSDYTVSDLRLMTLENIECIEILNGASSVLYGANAAISVINIKTKKLAQKALEGKLTTTSASYNTFAQNLNMNGKMNNFNYQTNIFNEKSDGISSAKGNLFFDKDDRDKQFFFARIGYSGKSFDLNINSGYNHNIYSYDNGAFKDSKNRGNDTQFHISGNINFVYPNGKAILNTRYTETKRIGKVLKKNVYHNQFFYQGKNFITEIYNNYEVNDYLNFTVGIQYENQKMNSKYFSLQKNIIKDILKDNDVKVYNLDAYANFNINYNNFNLDSGTRITNNSKFGKYWVYSINPYYIKELDNIYLKFTYSFATAFISPTLYQNYGSLPWTLPNPNLKPEKNQSHEINLGFGKKDKKLNLVMSLFHRKQKDVLTYVSKPDYTGIYQNINDNKVRGFEFSFDYQIINTINLGGNYSFVKNDKESTMLRQPKQKFNSYIEIKPFITTKITLSHQFIGKRNDVYYDDSSLSMKSVKVSDFNLFNLNINQNITRDIYTYLNIGNIFNKDYIDVIGYTTQNRNFILGISYKF